DLNKFGYKLAVDGIFGKATRQAVLAFQRRFGLKVDGIVGPEVYGALSTESASPNLKRGSRGNTVKVLQSTLNKNYPAYSKLVVDGIFGSATVAVVKEFQRRAGLAVDGIVGPR